MTPAALAMVLGALLTTLTLGLVAAWRGVLRISLGRPARKTPPEVKTP